MKRIYEKKDGAITLVETVLGYTQDIHGQVKGYLSDIKLMDYYTPYYLSDGEEKEICSDTFVTIISGRLIAYKQLRDDCIKVFATREEVENNPTILEDVAEYLEMVEYSDYEIVEFGGKNFFRVIFEGICPEPSNFVYSEQFHDMLLYMFDESAHIIMSVRGKLFLFSTNEDIDETIEKIDQYNSDFLNNEPFKLRSIFKIY